MSHDGDHVPAIDIEEAERRESAANARALIARLLLGWYASDERGFEEVIRATDREVLVAVVDELFMLSHESIEREAEQDLRLATNEHEGRAWRAFPPEPEVLATMPDVGSGVSPARAMLLLRWRAIELWSADWQKRWREAGYPGATPPHLDGLNNGPGDWKRLTRAQRAEFERLEAEFAAFNTESHGA